MNISFIQRLQALCWRKPGSAGRKPTIICVLLQGFPLTAGNDASMNLTWPRSDRVPEMMSQASQVCLDPVSSHHNTGRRRASEVL